MNLFVSDLDDTLVVCKESGILKRMRGLLVSVSSAEFARDIEKSKRSRWDFSLLFDPGYVSRVIREAVVVKKNLKVVAKYVSRPDWKFAVLSSRACEEAVVSELKTILKKELPGIDWDDKFDVGSSKCVNDKKYDEFERKDESLKAAHLRLLCGSFDEVIYMEDDPDCIEAARGLGLKNLEIFEV